MAYNLLKGKRGIIFGALNDQSIAWKVAERAYEEGAQIVLTNTEVAIRMGTLKKYRRSHKSFYRGTEGSRRQDRLCSSLLCNVYEYA